MSKKTCFDKVVDLMRGYQSLKHDLDANYKTMESSGRYSSRYLSDLKDTDNSRLSRERLTVAYRIDKIKEDYQKQLDKEFELSFYNGDSNTSTYTLEKLVHSGITPSAREFEEMAQTYSKSYYASRMLHDFAEKCGYQLNNVPVREDCEKAFNDFCQNVSNSLEPNNAYPIYVDADAARMSANSILDSLDKPLGNCRPIPKTFEEKVAAVAEDERLAKLKDEEMTPEEVAQMDANFKKGFWSVGHYKDERFMPTNLLNKLLNACGDLPKTALKETDTIKQATGEDLLTGEYKGGDIFPFYSYAKLLFSANQMPVSLDEKSDAFYRRLLAIEVKEQGEEIPNLSQKLKEDAEVLGFIRASVDALARLYKSGDKIDSPNSERFVHDYHRESDSVMSFMEDCTELKHGARVSRRILYNEYDAYCTRNGWAAVSNRTFFANIRGKGYTDYKYNGEWYVKNIDIALG